MFGQHALDVPVSSVKAFVKQLKQKYDVHNFGNVSLKNNQTSFLSKKTHQTHELLSAYDLQL